MIHRISHLLSHPSDPLLSLLVNRPFVHPLHLPLILLVTRELSLAPSRAFSHWWIHLMNHPVNHCQNLLVDQSVCLLLNLQINHPNVPLINRLQTRRIDQVANHPMILHSHQFVSQLQFPPINLQEIRPYNHLFNHQLDLPIRSAPNLQPSKAISPPINHQISRRISHHKTQLLTPAVIPALNLMFVLQNSQLVCHRSNHRHYLLLNHPWNHQLNQHFNHLPNPQFNHYGIPLFSHRFNHLSNQHVGPHYNHRSNLLRSQVCNPSVYQHTNHQLNQR